MTPRRVSEASCWARVFLRYRSNISVLVVYPGDTSVVELDGTCDFNGVAASIIFDNRVVVSEASLYNHAGDAGFFSSSYVGRRKSHIWAERGMSQRNNCEINMF